MFQNTKLSTSSNNSRETKGHKFQVRMAQISSSPSQPSQPPPSQRSMLVLRTTLCTSSSPTRAPVLFIETSTLYLPSPSRRRTRYQPQKSRDRDSNSIVPYPAKDPGALRGYNIKLRSYLYRIGHTGRTSATVPLSIQHRLRRSAIWKWEPIWQLRTRTFYPL